MRKILNAQGRKEDENLPHIHYFDDFCGEEKQTVKENILTCSRWRLKVKQRVGHRGKRYAEDAHIRESGPWISETKRNSLPTEASVDVDT